MGEGIPPSGGPDGISPYGPRSTATGGHRLLRNDRGDTAADYLGVVIVAVSILSALLATNVGQSIADTFRTKVCQVVSAGSCGQGTSAQNPPAAPFDYEPPYCTLSAASNRTGDQIDMGIFSYGNDFDVQEHDFKYRRDVNHDGKVDDKDKVIFLTFSSTDKAGLQKDFAPGVKVGKMGSQIDLGGGIKVGDGDTWAFESPEEARKFRSDIETIESYQQQQQMPGAGDTSLGNAILNLFGTGPLHDEQQAEDRVKKALGDNRRITFGKVGLDASAAGGLQLSPEDEKELSMKLGGQFSFSPEAIWTDNRFYNTNEYTYRTYMKYGVDAAGHLGPLTAGSSAFTTRTVDVTIGRDKTTGKLEYILTTQIVENGRGAKARVSAGGDNGKSGADQRGGKGNVGQSDNRYGIQAVTNIMNFDLGPSGDKDRAIAQKWLDGSGDKAAPFVDLFGNPAPTQRPGNDDPFGQLMFDKGYSSKIMYTGKKDATDYGLELNLGLSLGFSVNQESETQTLDNAQFLGAPHGEHRSYVPYSRCAQ
jgi:hypothetical protein